MPSRLIASLKATDAEIAEAVGVSERTVQRWKAGGEISARNRGALLRFAVRRMREGLVEIERHL